MTNCKFIVGSQARNNSEPYDEEKSVTENWDSNPFIAYALDCSIPGWYERTGRRVVNLPVVEIVNNHMVPQRTKCSKMKRDIVVNWGEQQEYLTIYSCECVFVFKYKWVNNTVEPIKSSAQSTSLVSRQLAAIDRKQSEWHTLS